MAVRLDRHRHGLESTWGDVRSDWLRLTSEVSKPPKATCSWVLFTELSPQAEYHLHPEDVCRESATPLTLGLIASVTPCVGFLAGQEQAPCGPLGGSFLTAHLSVYTEVWGDIRTFSSGLDLPLWSAS